MMVITRYIYCSHLRREIVSRVSFGDCLSHDYLNQVRMIMRHVLYWLARESIILTEIRRFHLLVFNKHCAK